MAVVVSYMPVVGGSVAQVPCRYGDLSQVGGIGAAIVDWDGVAPCGSGDLPLGGSVAIAYVRVRES